MAAGHCYSVAELSAMKTVYTKVAEAKKDKAPEHLMQVASYLGKKLEESHLLAGLKWSENLDDPNAALADEVLSYHWGGNACGRIGVGVIGPQPLHARSGGSSWLLILTEASRGAVERGSICPLRGAFGELL